ncbi:hypothetical protein SDC9_141132 [bioreactor metagenome]|uniref:Uncharacterized protein n=1 Tax=bioreactor metagenome TaxID=1076179 RepID=A0A645DWT8_9ZZZZ
MNEKRADCIFNGSEYCRLVRICSRCDVGKLDPELEKVLLDDIEHKLATFPQQTRDMAQGDLCRLCKGETREADCYAVVELARPESGSDMITSFAPALVPVCKKCRGRYSFSRNAGWIMASLFTLAMLIVLSVTAIREFFVGISPLTLPGLLAASAALGYLIGHLIGRIGRAGVNMHIMSLDELKAARAAGWEPVFASGKEPKVLFSYEALPDIAELLKKRIDTHQA